MASYSKYKLLLLESFALLIITIMANMGSISGPFAGGVIFYLLSGILAVVICVLVLIHKLKFVRQLMLADIVILAAGTIYSFAASPTAMY